jgi:predicted Zn-dependent peptidase
MKKLIFLPAILVLFALSACISIKEKLPDIQRVKTDAGHLVYYIPLDTETVTIRAAFLSNYIFTDDANPVVPHVGLPLIQQAGAGNIKPTTLIEEFDKLDADAELFAQPGAIRGKLVANVYEIEEAAKLANEVFVNSSLDERWFRRIVDNLAEKAAQDQNHSGVIGWSAMRQLSFDPQLARFWKASIEDIQAVTHKQINDWYQQSFYAEDATIVLSGPKDMASGLRAVDFLLDGLDQKQPRETKVEKRAFVPVAKTVLIENPAANDALVLLFDNLVEDARTSEFETFIATYELGATAESRLHHKLRDEMRAAYEAYAQFVDFDRQVRLIALGAQVAPEQAVNALNAASDVYDQLREDGFDQDGFDKVKSVYIDHFNSMMGEDELPPNIVLEALMEGHDPDFVSTLIPTLRAVDLEKQNRFLATQLKPTSNLLRIIVAPDIDAVEIEADCRVKDPDQLPECA